MGLSRFLFQMQDVLVTDLLHLTPSAMRWLMRRRVWGGISRHELVHQSGKQASLYRYDVPNPHAQRATLILHALYSHPFVMSHLADLAVLDGQGPVFSLYVSYDSYRPQVHRTLIKRAIDLIFEMLRTEGKEIGKIVLVGHSMGAIEAAYLAFVEDDARIASVISIAGRLKEDGMTPDTHHDVFRDTVQKVYQGILAKDAVTLYQIAGGKDWNAVLEAMIVREQHGRFHVIEDAQHFDILFHPDCAAKFIEYLRRAHNE